MQQKEGTPTFHDSMDETGEYCARGNKLGNKRQLPYDLAYKSNLMNKTNKQDRTKGMETRNRLDSKQREESGGKEWNEGGVTS